MEYLGLHGLQHFYDKYIRPLKDAAYKGVANNLTTEEEGSVLDARQGKELDEKKIDRDNIKNDLTTTEEGRVLDARQGKELNDKIDKIKKYVIEEGENENGKYVKWSNGDLEMWGDFDRTAAIKEKAGSLYASSILSITYPMQSLTRPNINLTVTAGGAIWGKPWDSASGYLRDFSYQLISPTEWNSASYHVSYYARRTWK